MVLKQMLVLSLLAWSAGAGAQPKALQPTGKWLVNFSDAQCTASRSYGTVEDPLSLLVKAPPLGDVMQVAIMKKGYAREAQQVEASIGLDEAPQRKTNLLMYSSPTKKLRVYLLNLPSTDFSAVRRAKSLSIRSDGLNETFVLSQMEPVLKIMEDCVADLRRVWNVNDPQGTGSPLTGRATAKLARLFKSDDYPASAILANKSGAVRFVVLVDEAGRVADCTIIETSGVAALDAQTCGIVTERAKFQPALGPDGKAAKDATIQQVVWRMN